MTFQLHPQLKQDSIFCGRFELCQLRMINDSQYPWFILVPEVNEITEIFQLDKQQQIQLFEESSLLAIRLKSVYNADKLNIASIGNIVPQLHLHHIVRYQADKAWPAPVWGKYPATHYPPDKIEPQLERIKNAFGKNLNTTA